MIINYYLVCVTLRNMYIVNMIVTLYITVYYEHHHVIEVYYKLLIDNHVGKLNEAMFEFKQEMEPPFMSIIV